ncbi:MAG: NACHT domain-containing protein [Limisphaerales bacterium]
MRLDPSRKERLEAEFGFLFAALDNTGSLLDNSPESIARLRWSTQMCGLLSERSHSLIHTSVAAMPKPMPAKTVVQPQAVKPSGTPEQKGEALEQAISRLFRTFFRLNGDIPWKIRQQQRGTQGGYDISIESIGKCEAESGQRVRCHIECKNYQNAITLREVAEKLLSEPHRPPVIDQWILISPRADASNELNRFIEEQKKELRFPFDVQIWSPETRLDEFFGLEPEVYDQFYTPHPGEQHPRQWTENKREEVIKKWKSLLRPPIRLPKGWTEYLRDPSKLCSPPEDVAKLNSAYHNYVPMRCRNSAGALLEKPLLAYIEDWLTQPKKPVLFLLGDFGDGKTCFTYYLARKLATACLHNRSGWVPLRLTLKKFPGDPRSFLRQRLEEFAADVGGWLELQNNFHRLVILDGFDEMSVKLDPATVTQNIRYLLACAKEFEGCKILITSRTHFFENRQDAKRLMDRLDTPPVFHLAPIGRQEVTRHLVGSVSGDEAQQILARVHQMSDPIGLASKPLFLEMLKDLLVSPNLPKDLDALTLYEHHIEQALLRKAELLDDPEFKAIPETTIRNLRKILGEIAEELQRSGKSFVSLSKYQKQTSKPFAELLWQLSGAEDEDKDAQSRVGARSLLTRAIHEDAKDEWAVDFCHRSMREYFVAVRLCETVESDTQRAITFLKEVPLNHEILQFAAERWRKAGVQTVKIRLLDIIRQSTHESKLGLVGGYALTLLFRLDPKLPRDFNWRDKIFDGADLEEADLSGMDFRNCSFRDASFANANFEDANFENCDLTGVLLEETKPVVALTVSPSAEKIMALYGDGVLREWHVQGRATSRVVALLPPDSSSVLGFHETGQMWHRTQHAWQFLYPWNADRVSRAGFALKENLRSIWPIGDVVAIVEEGDTGTIRLLLIELENKEELWSRAVKSSRLYASLGKNAVIWSDAEVGFRTISTRKDITAPENIISSPEPTCLAVYCLNSDVYFVAGGSSDGTIRVWRLNPELDIESHQKILETKVHEGPVTSVSFVGDSCVASGGADRTITLTRFAENMSLQGHIERRLRLSLRCRGMKIDGLKGPVEKELLSKLIIQSS